MAVVHNYLPGDPLLIDKIVYELKSQGIFDQFRKECIADVDTKPAYQNLRQRVEGSVSGFLSKQKWSSDMNKNQLREMLRKNIHESGFLETGVERIVDQVVNPKMNSIFLPKVTEIVYKFLGIEKPTNEKKDNLKLSFSNDNLLPTDLEAVSPESEKKFDIGNSFQNLDDSKIDEDESPPFEPLEEKPIYIPPEENSIDSHLSGISGLISHDSNHSQEFSKPIQMEISNQDSLLSKQSSEGRLSIVMSDDNDTKMEVYEDSIQKIPKTNETKLKDFDFNSETLNNNALSKKMESKSEEKSKSERSSKSHDKHKSRHDSKSDRKEDKDKRSDKDRKEHRDKHSSRDKGKEKDRKDAKTSNSKSEKDRSENKSDKDSKSESKNEKDKSKSSSSSSSNRHSSSSRDKEKSSSSKKESSSSSKDRGDNKDKSKCSSSSNKDKDSKYRDSKGKGDSKSSSKHDSKSDKHKKDDKHRSDRHSSSSKNRDKDKKDSKKEKKENKDDHFSSKKKSDRRSTDRDSNDGQSGLKSSSSSFDSTVSSQTQNKNQESSNSNSNNGSGDSGNSDAIEEYMNNNTPVTILNEKLEELKEVAINTRKEHIEVPTLKLIKPKFASNIHEAKRLMKIRKQISLLEKQNFIDISRTLNKNINENNKFKTSSGEIENKSKNNKIKQTHDNRVTKTYKSSRKTLPVHEVKASTTEPLSPPLKSSVVSAATWDALEAKLHESINYSTCYDVVDTAEDTEVPVYNKDDCLYLNLDISKRTEKYLQYINEYIRNLQNTVEKHSIDKPHSKPIHVRNHVNNTNKSVKRKFSDYHSDLKNNNKKFNTHHIEVHENFSLPLSPAESDNSIDKKSDTSESSYKSLKKTDTEFMDKIKKSVRGSAKTQRYSSEDLYKPRPIFGGSRRRNARNLGID